MSLPTPHSRARMAGRDMGEEHRTATPLELLFDLTFVVAFGLAADELAHYLAEDHLKAALIGFGFATFAITWAWINFSWFASAFDTDDWVYRLTTMIQMVGVIVLALGLPAMFESIDAGETVDNRVMVAGYVVMRVAMVFQWGRAARQDPEHRSACVTYIVAIGIAQVGWIAVLVAEMSLAATLVCAGILVLVEFAGPYIAETRKGGTPWHAHHIAERYGLLVIIALGEGIVGTIVTLTAVVGPEGTGWTVDAARAGGGRRRADLRDVVDLLRGPERRHPPPAARPIVRLGLRAHRDHRRRGGDRRRAAHRRLLPRGGVGARRLGERALRGRARRGLRARAVRPLRLPDALDRPLPPLARSRAPSCSSSRRSSWPAAGLSMAWCLVVLSLAPWVTVAGYELRGHRHNAEVLAALAAD